MGPLFEFTLFLKGNDVSNKSRVNMKVLQQM